MKRSPEPADRASIRRANLGLILRHLHEQGGRSRTRIADEIGLPKATVSSLIAELVDLRLVREGELERAGAIGRPQRSVELDGSDICGVGLEIAVDHLYVIALDLRGGVPFNRRIALDVRGLDPQAALDTVGKVLADAITALRDQGRTVVGATIAAPGGYDPETDQVTIATNLGWQGVPLLRRVAGHLGPSAPPLQVGNDAKLGAVAEYVAASASGVRDMIYVSGTVGVGAGVIADGRLLRDAGEVGHLPLDPELRQCACGRRGCWETMVDLDALLRHAADPGDPVHDPALDLGERLAEIRRRAESGDPRTRAALERVAAALSTGVSVLADVLGPESIVLGGYFAYFADYFVEPVQQTIDDRRIEAGAECVITASTFGFTSAARGGAHLALEAVFQDPGGVR